MAYERSAALYDAIYAWKDYAKDVDGLLALLESHGITGGAWLDVACGTGKHLAQVPTDYRRMGVELDPEMAVLARERLTDVPIYVGDMRTFRLEDRFQVVSCLFSSIGYMTDLPDLSLAVRNMAEHLVPGGILLIEPWFLPHQFTDGHLATDTYDGEGLKICRVGRSWTEGPVSCMDLHHLVGDASGVQYFVETHRMGLFTDYEYRQAFEAAGLAVERVEPGPTGRGLYVGRNG